MGLRTPGRRTSNAVTLRPDDLPVEELSDYFELGRLRQASSPTPLAGNRDHSAKPEMRLSAPGLPSSPAPTQVCSRLPASARHGPAPPAPAQAPAVFGVMAFLPETISLIVLTGRFIATASLRWLIPLAASSSRINSPGGIAAFDSPYQVSRHSILIRIRYTALVRSRSKRQVGKGDSWTKDA